MGSMAKPTPPMRIDQNHAGLCRADHRRNLAGVWKNWGFAGVKPVEGACPWAIFVKFCRCCEAYSRAETRIEDFKSCD